MTKNQQIYLSALKGVVDLVFETSGLPQGATPSNSLPTSPINSPTVSSPLLTIPETLYLDKARLLQLGSEVNDTTALHMFMLLFRQLVFSEPLAGLSACPPKVDLADMMKLKHEIRALGSSRLGSYLLTVPPTDDPEILLQDRQNVKQDIVLQITKRANDARHRGSQPLSVLSSPMGKVPDQRIISVAQHWAEYNMHPGSALSVMLRNRLRDVLFDAVVSLAYPGRDSMTGKMLSIDFFSTGQVPTSFGAAHVGTPMAGMEALTDEIRRLAEKISRVTLIHLNSYLPLYEMEGFLSS
jgi:T-complex protein 11